MITDPCGYSVLSMLVLMVRVPPLSAYGFVFMREGLICFTALLAPLLCPFATWHFARALCPKTRFVPSSACTWVCCSVMKTSIKWTSLRLFLPCKVIFALQLGVVSPHLPGEIFTVASLNFCQC